MFTKENVRTLIAGFDKRVTPEEFEKSFSMPNKDVEFSEMLKKYSNLPDVPKEIAALSIKEN